MKGLKVYYVGDCNTDSLSRTSVFKIAVPRRYLVLPPSEVTVFVTYYRLDFDWNTGKIQWLFKGYETNSGYVIKDSDQFSSWKGRHIRSFCPAVGSLKRIAPLRLRRIYQEFRHSESYLFRQAEERVEQMLANVDRMLANVDQMFANTANTSRRMDEVLRTLDRFWR